jgi:hypothetical protein
MLKENKLSIDENKEFDALDNNKDGRISHREADITPPASVKEKLSSKKKK